MTAKLIVHKFETGLNFKYLQITLNEGRKEVYDTKFSEWLEGSTFHKRKKNTTRLVVKIVSGEERSIINLDTCAKLLDSQEKSIFDDLTQINRNSELSSPSFNKGIHFFNNKNITNTNNNEDLINKFNDNEIKSDLNVPSPLDYNLEKIKENNARIMENIQMLNRTLNYTKKKEILDMACPKSMRTFPCETCGKSFVYETGLKRHNTMQHAMTEPQLRWQVVWTCVECYQVWPQQQLALNHSNCCCNSNSPDCVQEIKTSLLLQCEFCEKVYTSIPILIQHTQTHTTKDNFECNACTISFVSYKCAEEHWLTCPWLKTSYSFSLPKMLLCNACDRKFRNYEQLYNHRYKIGHFMPKPNGNASGLYLYQCELCEKTFQSTSSLQVHKKQSHPFQDFATGDNVNCNEYITDYNDYENQNFSDDKE